MHTKLTAAALAVSLAFVPAVYAQQTLEKTTVKGQDDKQQKVAVKVIDSDQVDAEMIGDIFDTVRYIPGVDVNNTGNRFGDNGFNIRGMEGDAVAITVDGLAQGESLDPITFSRYGMYSSTRNAIEPESVKTIEIVKGASSVVAGSGALGGAVMYTTKDADDFLEAEGDDIGGNVKLGFDGRNKESLISLSLAGRIEGLEALLIVTKRESSETQTHDKGADIAGPSRGQADEFDSDKTNILAKLSYQINPEHEVGLVYEGHDGERDGTPLSRQSTRYFDFKTHDESDRTRKGLFYNWQANNTLFDLAELRYEYQEIYTRGSTAFLNSGRGPTILRNEDRNFNQELTSFILDFSKELDQGDIKHNIVYGVKSSETEVKNSLKDIRYKGTDPSSGLKDGYPEIDSSWVPETKAKTRTAYISDIVTLTPELKLQAGLRYDSTEYNPKVDDTFKDPTGTAVKSAEFSALSWSLNLQYEFVPDHSVIAGIGTGFKAPTTQELYLNTNRTRTAQDVARVQDPNTGAVRYLPTGRTEIDLNTVANPDLDAEEGTNYQISYQWQADQGFFNATLFRSDYDNFIINLDRVNPYSSPITTAFFNFFNPACRKLPTDACWFPSQLAGDTYGVPTNAGEVEITGFELEGGYRFTPEIMATFSYSHVNGEYANTVEGNAESNVSASHKKGQELESVAPDTAVLGLRYASQDDGWGVSTYLRHTEGKDKKEGFSATYYSDSFTVVDLRAFYEITDDLVVRAAVTNLFDKAYATWQRLRFVRGGPNAGGFFGGVRVDKNGNNGIDRYNAPGREFSINLNYRF